MKKEVRLYNIFFPLWYLVLFWPLLVPSLPVFLLLLPINFAIDSLVLVVTAKCLHLEHKARLWARGVLPVWLLGFLCDFLGAALVGLLIWLVEGNLSGDSLFFPATTLYALPGVVLSGVLIYTLNRFLSFRKSGLEKGQLHKLCLSLAVFTAPYLMMIPIYGMKSPTS